MFKGGGSGGSNGVPAVIPAGERKIVHNLKEIVNCSEQEIYAALKECNMDPNEAVNRLLSRATCLVYPQVKDTIDPRPRGVVVSSRVGRTGVDRYPVRAIVSDSSKPMPKREIGSHAFLGSLSSASAMSAPNINRQLAHSDQLPLENKMSAIGENDLITSSVQSSSGFQRSWGGTSGQVSMAVIVKMGKPEVKSPLTQNHSVHGSHGDFQMHDQSSKLYKSDPPSISDHFPSNDDDWSLEDRQAPPLKDDGWPPFDN
ncbi:hypothetical protein MLD38_010103 [Melastoma candidum]|uniref:Uncharacterized protein n=1 Tax=Melastoma candidum TaxID=119954 RepID=A0ACB9R2B1_9MYRT|nr:hypothetical protein MLD38_010103 [Melastoma candidum]